MVVVLKYDTKLQGSFLLLQFSSSNSLELVKEQWSSYRNRCLDYLNATAPATGERLSCPSMTSCLQEMHPGNCRSKPDRL